MQKYIDKILKATKYVGNCKPLQKEISASQLDADPQQVLLRYKYGVIQDNEIGQNTIGSLIHYALERILKSKYIKTEQSFNKEIYRGFSLTGSIDILDLKDDIITDIKVTKTYAIKQIKKDPYHQYVWQLNAYRYLAEEKYQKSFKMQIMAFNKQGGFDVKTGLDIKDMEFINIPIIENEILISRFKELVDFILIGNEKQCDDLYIRRVKCKIIPLKCKKYCSYNKVCQFYNEEE